MSVCEYIFVCNDNTITVPPLSPCTSIDMTHAMDIFSSMNLPLFSQFTSQKSHLSATKIRWKKNNKHTMYIVHSVLLFFGSFWLNYFGKCILGKRGPVCILNDAKNAKPTMKSSNAFFSTTLMDFIAW